MRNSMRLVVAAFRRSRSLIPRCTSTAQRTASTTLANSDQHAVAGGLDDPAAMLADLRIDQLARGCALRRSSVPSSSAPISREYPATSAARIAARRRVEDIAPLSRRG